MGGRTENPDESHADTGIRAQTPDSNWSDGAAQSQPTPHKQRHGFTFTHKPSCRVWWDVSRFFWFKCGCFGKQWHACVLSCAPRCPLIHIIYLLIIEQQQFSVELVGSSCCEGSIGLFVWEARVGSVRLYVSDVLRHLIWKVCYYYCHIIFTCAFV